MLYTIGIRKGYLQAFGKPPVTKIGRQPDYPGGYAFKTIEDAERERTRIRRPDFEIFGLLAEWGKDTTPSDGGLWHNLLVDREVVMIQDVTN